MEKYTQNKYRLAFCTLLSFIVFLGSASAQPKLKEIWKTDTILPVPESVVMDSNGEHLYVSLIGPGDTGASDGNGAIALLKTNGEVVERDLISGLNSPKGLGLIGDLLYVADLKELVVIDVKSRKIKNRIRPKDVTMLNDVAVDHRGNVYVSDSKGGSILKFTGTSYEKIFEGLSNPNGVFTKDDDLYFVASGKLYKSEGAKSKPVVLAEGMEASTDGIHLDKSGNFLISAWAGVVYHVSNEGQVSSLLDLRKEKINTADFFFDEERGTLYLPTFFGNRVIAYEVSY